MNRSRQEPDVDFGAVAEFYLGRTPYLPRFFAEAAKALGLTKDSFVLDLACGTGELSIGFSPYCGSVLAIDRSPEMIAARRLSPENVRFVASDLNAETIPAQQPADLVAIGRAIHHFDKGKFLPVLGAAAKSHSNILICGAVIEDTTPWFPSYEALRRRYGDYRDKIDYYGKRFFADTEWLRARTITVEGKMQCSVQSLWRHALSYSRTQKAILNDEANFKMELERILAPHYWAPQRVDAGIFSWGVQYARVSR